MMNKLIYIVPLLLLFFYNFCAAETSTDSVKYERGFQFKVGVYLTFEDWKNNDPIPPDRILNKIDKDDPGYFKKIFNEITLYYIDKYGEEAQIDPLKLWGYSNGKYVFKRGYLIQLIGAMCFYVRIVDLANPSSLIRSDISVYSGPVGGFPMQPAAIGPYAIRDDQRYILDFYTGENYKLTKKNFEIVLQKDPDLFAEYKRSKASKKDKILIFMGKYNEKHPVYFKN